MWPGRWIILYTNILEAIDGFGSLLLLCNDTSEREIVDVVVVGVIIVIIIRIIISKHQAEEHALF